MQAQDTEDLFKGLALCAEDKKLRDVIGENAKLMVADHFRTNDETDKWLDLYRSILKKKKPQNNQ